MNRALFPSRCYVMVDWRPFLFGGLASSVAELGKENDAGHLSHTQNRKASSRMTPGLVSLLPRALIAALF